MKILIIDIIRANMFVGLINNEERHIQTIGGLGKHNETLLPTIDKLLTDNSLNLQSLDAVAINIGAGSFTGIRVGVSTVKAFCSALKDLKCIQFNTLELLAYSSNEPAKYSLVISAGATNMYVAECDKKVVLNQYHNTLEEFENVEHQKIIGLEEEKDILPLKEISYINKLKYFDLVEEKFNANQFTSADNLEPLYLRLSQAERELQAKNDKTTN